MTITLDIDAGRIATAQGETDDPPEVDTMQINGQVVHYWQVKEVNRAAQELAEAVVRNMDKLVRE